MQALVVTTEGKQPATRVVERPKPEPAAGEVRIRITLAGICATDLEITRGYMQFAGVIGHEFVGTVDAGDDALVGQRVVGEINCPCGACELCRRGLGNHCPQRTVLGIAGRDGAFADYLALPAANCHVVPDGVSDEQAVFTEPLAAAVHVLDARRAAQGGRVAVLGSGRLGLLVALVLRDEPGELELIGRNPRTLALATRWGLRTRPVGEVEPAPAYDVVVDCTGSPDGLRLAMATCRPCGTIVLKSTYAAPDPLNPAPLVINEVSVVGSRCGSFPPALERLARGNLPVAEMISATYPLSDGVAALAAAAQPENLKVLLRPGTA